MQLHALSRGKVASVKKVLPCRPACEDTCVVSVWFESKTIGYTCTVLGNQGSKDSTENVAEEIALLSADSCTHPQE
jgi:hypothetical protein